MNIKDTFFDDIFLWMNHKRMKNTDFCSKEPAICKISQPIILKRENSKHGKFSNHPISEVLLLFNHFIEIHSLLFLENVREVSFFHF